MDLDALAEQLRARFDDKMAARERALPAARHAIRLCANAIRAIHRGETDRARELMDEARREIDDGRRAVAEHPDVGYAGFLQDAQKEYAEARITEALVAGREPPGPEEVGVEVAPYLNGMAEAIGEARRQILDLLRRGDVAGAESMLATMDEFHYLLASMDYPDAITGNLRRSTDVARGILEKTRGDLSMSLVQRDLREALEQHSREISGG